MKSIKLKDLIGRCVELARIMHEDVRLVPCDGSDKRIDINADLVGCRKFTYVNAQIILEPPKTPYSGTKVLIINGRRQESFLKKLKKYEDLDGAEWELECWSFDYALRKAEKLRHWTREYLEATDSSVLSACRK